jgi:hypothetical protein
MDDGALIDAQQGTIEIVADEDIVLGGLVSSNATSDAIRITSQSAALVDGGDADPDINANQGLVTIRTLSGIGDGDALETVVARVDSNVTGIGETNLREDDSVVLDSVITSDGAITVEAGGTITATSVLSRGTNDRDIRLEAIGSTSDVKVGSIIALGDSDVHLIADDDVLKEITGAVSVEADDLRLDANNENDDQDEAIDLETNVNDLEASVTGSARGDIQIREVDSINLASSDRQDDEIVAAANGQIVVSAGDQITIVDHSVGDDGSDLKSDPELIARGSSGRIDLDAVREIQLQDDVQLHSEKITREIQDPETRPMPEDLGLSRQDRSVYLESDSIVLGERIEIFTGENQATARIFSPRPLESDMPDDEVIPAFYDPDSIRTNILEQALINDATGILTLDLGREGERGLTIDIDWGAPTRRFQQINGLPADQAVFVRVDAGGEPTTPVQSSEGPPLLTVEHFYTEKADILDSRLNGRGSSTDDLEVRFSVRHHESILVLGREVQQGPEFEPFDIPGVPDVPKGEVSSTDNIATSREEIDGLESGRTRFIIPPLSIPVAFFPVREVIPEIETQEIVVRSETTLALTQTTFETVESTSSSIVGREEYFRIRVLSPDPDGEDLAIERLPDDILEGDKIKKLFEKLPDGRYEIEYVLGDANVRSILPVDVRGGQATTAGEELDEGVLKLRRLGEDDAEAEEDSENGLPEEPTPEQTGRELPLRDSVSAPVTRVVPEVHRSSLPAASAGLLLTSVMRRRRRRLGRKRLSVASRFAARAPSRHENVLEKGG